MKPWTAKFLVAIAVLVPLAFFFGACASDQKSGGGPFGQSAAAWAQAIGTVGAIVASAYYATKQINAQAQQRRDDREELIQAIRNSAEYAIASFSLVDQALPNSRIDEFRMVVHAIEQTWSTVIREFMDLPIDRWPSPFIYLRARQFLHAYNEFEGYIKQLAQMQQITEREWTRARGKRSALSGAWSMLDTACAAHIERLV